MTATQEADASFKTFEQSRRTLEIAQVDSRFKVGGGFQKPLGLRTSKKLVLNDVEAAIKAIGLTEGIREAVLSSARDYRKLRGALPAGVAEIEERVFGVWSMGFADTSQITPGIERFVDLDTAFNELDRVGATQVLRWFKQFDHRNSAA